MEKANQTDQYFSLSEIRKRVHRQQRQQLTRILNIGVTLVLAAVMIIFIYGAFPLPFRSFAERETAIPQLLALLTFFIVFFVVLLVHRIWLNGQMKIDAEIDEAMRAKRNTERYREDDVYRLSDDGELFYDREEVEYDLKPKRKREG
jgi:protein-S-isoprenylcysteine O-methyltransferase Ste14